MIYIKHCCLGYVCCEIKFWNQVSVRIGGYSAGVIEVTTEKIVVIVPDKVDMAKSLVLVATRNNWPVVGETLKRQKKY